MFVFISFGKTQHQVSKYTLSNTIIFLIFLTIGRLWWRKVSISALSGRSRFLSLHQYCKLLRRASNCKLYWLGNIENLCHFGHYWISGSFSPTKKAHEKTNFGQSSCTCLNRTIGMNHLFGRLHLFGRIPNC